MADYKDRLLETLEVQRAHVLGILEGLSDEALHQKDLPSGWSCLGLLRHLALDNERFWFSDVMAGQVLSEAEAAEAVGDAWDVPDAISGQEMFDLYRREIARANVVIASYDLSEPPHNWPAERWPDWQLKDLNEILLHVITETACHAGHFDVVRELTDGRLWMVL